MGNVLTQPTTPTTPTTPAITPPPTTSTLAPANDEISPDISTPKPTLGPRKPRTLNSQPPPPASSSSNTGLYIGLGVGIPVVLILIGVVIFIIYRRSKNSEDSMDITDNDE
jgi:hypothetical protein